MTLEFSLWSCVIEVGMSFLEQANENRRDEHHHPSNLFPAVRVQRILHRPGCPAVFRLVVVGWREG